MSGPVINVEDLEFIPFGNGKRFECQLGLASRNIGATQLGYNLTVVPAGKSAFPYHNHRAAEEMFFILEGQGELRMGEQQYPLKPGDFIACPAGGTEVAHQITNTGENELRYLAVSAERTPEVVQYPDSGKCGVTHILDGVDERGIPKMWRLMLREADGAVDYFDGEDQDPDSS